MASLFPFSLVLFPLPVFRLLPWPTISISLLPFASPLFRCWSFPVLFFGDCKGEDIGGSGEVVKQKDPMEKAAKSLCYPHALGRPPLPFRGLVNLGTSTFLQFIGLRITPYPAPRAQDVIFCESWDLLLVKESYTVISVISVY